MICDCVGFPYGPIFSYRKYRLRCSLVHEDVCFLYVIRYYNPLLQVSTAVAVILVMWSTNGYIQGRGCRSVQNLRPEDDWRFLGGPTFCLWSEGTRTNYDRLGGGLGYFCITHDQKYPQMGSKHIFAGFRGLVLAHYVFRFEPSYGGKAAFYFQGLGGGFR